MTRFVPVLSLIFTFLFSVFPYAVAAQELADIGDEEAKLIIETLLTEGAITFDDDGVVATS